MNIWENEFSKIKAMIFFGSLEIVYCVKGLIIDIGGLTLQGPGAKNIFGPVTTWELCSEVRT